LFLPYTVAQSWKGDNKKYGPIMGNMPFFQDLRDGGDEYHWLKLPAIQFFTPGHGIFLNPYNPFILEY